MNRVCVRRQSDARNTIVINITFDVFHYIPIYFSPRCFIIILPFVILLYRLSNLVPTLLILRQYNDPLENIPRKDSPRSLKGRPGFWRLFKRRNPTSASLDRLCDLTSDSESLSATSCSKFWCQHQHSREGLNTTCSSVLSLNNQESLEVRKEFASSSSWQNKVVEGRQSPRPEPGLPLAERGLAAPLDTKPMEGQNDPPQPDPKENLQEIISEIKLPPRRAWQIGYHREYHHYTFFLYFKHLIVLVHNIQFLYVIIFYSDFVDTF